MQPPRRPRRRIPRRATLPRAFNALPFQPLNQWRMMYPRVAQARATSRLVRAMTPIASKAGLRRGRRCLRKQMTALRILPRRLRLARRRSLNRPSRSAPTRARRPAKKSARTRRVRPNARGLITVLRPTAGRVASKMQINHHLGVRTWPRAAACRSRIPVGEDGAGRTTILIGGRYRGRVWHHCAGSPKEKRPPPGRAVFGVTATTGGYCNNQFVVQTLTDFIPVSASVRVL
jgi:hypothetical protein